MTQLKLYITIDVPDEHATDAEYHSQAIADVREALQYEFLEPITITQLPFNFTLPS